MRFYNQLHRFYVGGDLHARTLYLHVLDDQGQTRFEKNLAANPETFLDAIAPFRENLVVGVECMFAWYWLASNAECGTRNAECGTARKGNDRVCRAKRSASERCWALRWANLHAKRRRLDQLVSKYVQKTLRLRSIIAIACAEAPIGSSVVSQSPCKPPF